MHKMRNVMLGLVFTSLFACGGHQTSKPSVPPEATTPSESSTKISTDLGVKSASSQQAGGYYLDDGPDSNPPANLDAIPDAVPKHEPIDPNKNKPYQALGETYTPIKNPQAFTQQGIASWYGKRFHGKKTANGEIYDMYAMTAAHPTLPIPSYVKVVNPSNNRSVIVRINDRGPFKHQRIIDLSYAAAHKLRIVERGSAMVHVEAVDVNANAVTQKHAQHPSSVASKVDPASTALTSNNSHPIQLFFVQAGAFKFEQNAQKLKQKIQNLGIAPQTDINHVYNDRLHRLKLGPYRHQSQASQIASELRKKLNISSIIKHQ